MGLSKHVFNNAAVVGEFREKEVPEYVRSYWRLGGKQYRVQEGDVVFVEKLGLVEGEAYTFDKVLAVFSEDGVKVGTPYVEGATVCCDNPEGRSC